MSGADDKPLLVLSREGKGRVALLLSDQAWLWARGFRDGGPHLDLLRRLGHWLMKEPDLEEEALRATARGNLVTIERQTLADTVEPVVLTSPSGGTQTATLAGASPGLWQATVDTERARPLPPRATASSPPSSASARRTRASTRRCCRASSNLSPLAEATGGSVRRVATKPDDTPRVPSIVALSGASRFSGGDYIGIRITDSSVVRGVGVTPIFLGFIGLVLLAASLLAAWLGEARLGRASRSA